MTTKIVYQTEKCKCGNYMERYSSCKRAVCPNCYSKESTLNFIMWVNYLNKTVHKRAMTVSFDWLFNEPKQN